jgi:hypothetical protein
MQRHAWTRAVPRVSSRLPSSELEDLVTNGKLNEIAVRVQLELAHNVGAVGVDGLHADVKGRGDFPVSPSSSRGVRSVGDGPCVLVFAT